MIALLGDVTVGCCALLALPERSFEIGKMAVAEQRRGQGIGKKLLARVIDRARELGARRLYLESSTKLPDAIHVYASQGFTHLPPERVRKSPYARSDVYMELLLK